MPTLLDALRQNVEQPEAAQPGIGQIEPQGDQSDQVASRLRTRLTGKVAEPGESPRRFSSGEQAAVQSGQAQMGQLAKQGQIQSEQFGQQQADTQQRQDIQKQQILQERQTQQMRSANQAADILNQFEVGQKQLNNQKDLQDLQQVGFHIRLNNKQYLQDLNTAGSKQRLDDQLKFKEAYTQQVFADNLDATKRIINIQDLTAADARNFNAAISQINLDQAINLAGIQRSQAQASGIYQGIGGLVSGGAQALNAYGSQEEKMQADNRAVRRGEITPAEFQDRWGEAPTGPASATPKVGG